MLGYLSTDITCPVLRSEEFSESVAYISLFIIFDQMANLHIKIKNENLCNEKRYLKIVNSFFRLVQTICLCLKMA